MAKDETTAASAATESETSTGKEVEGSTEEQGKTSDNTVPQARLKEVVDQRNEFKEKLDTLEAEAGERTKELGQMVELLQARESDTQIVNAIRALAADGNPEHREVVTQLENYLAGNEESVETGEKTPEQGVADTKAALAEARTAMENIAGNQQNELAVLKADLLAEKYFNALPPEYTDTDKEVISTLLTDKVDWEAIEKDPNSLSEKVPEAFESVLKLFGEPRGKPVEVEVEGETKQTTATETKPVEDEVPEHLKTDWGELKEIQTPKGEVLKPVHSDEDFGEALAAELKRITRG